MLGTLCMNITGVEKEESPFDVQCLKGARAYS